MPTLTRAEQTVYEYIKVLSGEGGTCRPSNKRIATDTCTSVTLIRSAFGKMEKRGDGIRTYEHCTQQNKQTAAWVFFGSDAWFDWVRKEHQRVAHEIEWLTDLPIHYDIRYSTPREVLLTENEIARIMLYRPEIDTLASTIQENTF